MRPAEFVWLKNNDISNCVIATENAQSIQFYFNSNTYKNNLQRDIVDVEKKNIASVLSRFFANSSALHPNRRFSVYRKIKNTNIATCLYCSILILLSSRTVTHLFPFEAINIEALSVNILVCHVTICLIWTELIAYNRFMRHSTCYQLTYIHQ